MSQNQATESPIDSAKKLVAATRQDKTAKMVAHNDARISLDLALHALKAEGTPAARKALTACEQTARYTELELSGASERHTAATDNLAKLERESKLTQHALRASSVGFESFSSATSKAVQKIADARARLADAEAEAASIVRSFDVQAESVRAEGAAIGAPPVAVLPYAKIFSGLVAKIEGKPAAAIISEVFQTTAPAGLSPEIALAAVNAGTDMRRVVSLVAKLRDSTGRAAISARAVVLGGFESQRGDKTLTAVGRFNAALNEAREARAALAEIGIGIGIKIGGAADAVAVDPLSERLASVGADKAYAAFLALRMCAGLTMPGYPTAEMLEAHRTEAAQKIIAQLEAMGLGEYVERPSARAQGLAHVPSPAGFVNAAQAL